MGMPAATVEAVTKDNRLTCHREVFVVKTTGNNTMIMIEPIEHN